MTVVAQGRLPHGFGIALADRTHVCRDGRSLLAGSGRVLHLPSAAAEVVARLPLSIGDDEVVAGVARLLLDEGAVDPWWPGLPGVDADVLDVTVVVPTRDRAASVATLLATLPDGLPVVVVDDGSADPDALARVVTQHGALLVRHPTNRGPAAARNTGLRAVRTSYVVFCDSDVLPEPGWLATLRRHLDDPAVAAAGPRVLGSRERRGDDWIERYEQARSSLDLGSRAAGVRVHGSVSFLPGACLLARVAALGTGFDESMRAGEDVDLVWRLLSEGHQVRYEPAAVVRHDHRTGLAGWLARKAFYGTSGAPLAARHPGSVAPFVTSPASALLVVALLAQRRWSAPVVLLALGASMAGTTRRLGAGDSSSTVTGSLAGSATLTVEGAVAATWEAASALTRHHWPLTALWALASPRGRRVLVLAALGEGVADHRRVRPRQRLGPYLVAHRLDDLAFGAGLWWGSVRSGSAHALLPAVRRSRTGMRAGGSDREA